MAVPTRVEVRIAETPGERSACMDLRRAVFIDEQHVSEADEWDALDAGALHVLAWEGDRPVGTARMRWVAAGVAKAERVAVVLDRRGAGIGRRLMDTLIDHARAGGAVRMDLAAQVTAIPFYQRLGFCAEGPVFLDAGIPHRHMHRIL